MATKGTCSSILIVPATSYEIGSSGGKKPKTPKKSAIVCGTPGADDVAGAFYDPRNFLVRGGHRAFEQKIINMNKSAIQELRTANAVLAEELIRARSGSDQARDQLREKESSIETLQATIERMEKARRLVDKKHLLQLKELNRRYKEEQAQRLGLESECAHLRASKDVIQQQVDSLQEERAQLMDMLNAQRSNCSRLEATVAADTATIAELRSRMQAAESRLADEVTARQELFGRHKAQEADLKLMSERCGTLAASHSEVESRLRAATSKVQLLEDELEAARAAAQAEKAACNSERQRSAILQSDLTQLQSTSQLAAAAVAADQAELERLRTHSEQLMSANDSLRNEVARLREEVLHLTAQGVAAQASSQGLQQQRDELQQQCNDLLQQLESVRDAMEGQERSLREEAAARLRAAQEETAARQRAWEGQMRAREKAWEDERMLLLRTHEDEQARKDIEILGFRERMREAQSSMTELAAEMSTFKLQGEHYAEAFKDNEELKERLAGAQATIAARDGALAEAAASHAAQLELWKAEANEVAQAAAWWKQRCSTLQSQLEAKESEAEAKEQELRSLSERLGTSEAERVRFQEAMAAVESKLELATQESNSYRLQLSDVLASHQGASRQVEAAQQDLHLRDLQMNKLNQSLNDEVARSAQLRQDLSAAVTQHAKELEAKRRALADLTDQLQEAERARAAAQAETELLRDRAALLTREVGRARLAAEVAVGRSSGGSGPGPASGGGGGGSLPRFGDEPWARRQSHNRGIGQRGGTRRSGEALGTEEEGDADPRVNSGRGQPGGRGDYDVSSLEEEAESWFNSLDDEPGGRGRGHGRAGAGAGSRAGGDRGSRRASDAARDVHIAEPTPPSAHQQQQQQLVQADALHSRSAGPAKVMKAYDVTISPKQHGATAATVAPVEVVPVLAAVPQPQPYRQVPGVVHAGAVPSGASAAIPTGGGAAATGAAYTAVITTVEGGTNNAFTAHVSATPPAQTGLASRLPGSGSSMPGLSGPRYPAPAGYRAFGVSLAQQQHQQPQLLSAGYTYGRSDVSRLYGSMTPLSPVMSESASNTSSNLQQRLQRLLGTGKLS